jgi:hypothetical protein
VLSAGGGRSPTACCYAKQTKVWTSDPEGRRWETHVVHAESDARDGVETPCCRAVRTQPLEEDMWLVIDTRGERFPRIAVQLPAERDPNAVAHEIMRRVPDSGPVE